ncbi:hypothetical protein [Nonomuraea bangladeshensis]|uniref:hypothetical protein n=1 Tax=Nonomuraea bangladeshensis TaxID=404385 RepID=UPI003C2B5EDD
MDRKSTRTAAVRQLDSWGPAQVIPQPGSRRLLVEATAGIESLPAAGHARARTLIAALRYGKGLVEPGPARERLRDVIGLFSDYVEVGEHLLARSRRRDT